MEDFDKITGVLLKQLREGNGYTLKAMAEKMGKKSTYDRYIQLVEAGQKSPTLKWIHKYLAAMGLHTYLLTTPEDGFAPRSEEVMQVLDKLHKAKRKAGSN